MKKLKNILAENMRRFGTKNLNEEFSDLEKIGFSGPDGLGGPRDPKTGNLIAPDADQNNNGYPDSTEGNLARTNVDTYYTKPPTGFQFTNKPIDSQANKLLMNYWDNILNSQEKQQEYQDDRKAGDSNWRDGIELYNRYMLIAGRAENQLKVSGYIIKK